MSKSRFSFFFQCAFAFLFCTLLSVKAITKYFCMINTKHRLQRGIAGEVGRCCFSINLIAMQGERVPPLCQPSRRHRIAQGILQLGQSGLEPLQCVKLSFQNGTPIWSTAPTSWGSTSCLSSEPERC